MLFDLECTRFMLIRKQSSSTTKSETGINYWCIESKSMRLRVQMVMTIQIVVEVTLMPVQVVNRSSIDVVKT